MPRARTCSATVISGHRNEETRFEARRVTELLVHLPRDDAKRGRAIAAASKILPRATEMKVNEDLNYLIMPIPVDHAHEFFQEVQAELLKASHASLIEPRCLPLQTMDSREESGSCVDSLLLADMISLPNRTRSIGSCDNHNLDDDRKAIQLPALLAESPGSTTLVVVMDVGFGQYDQLEPVLGEAMAHGNGSRETVNGWDYCKNRSIDATDSQIHGTQVSGLIAGPCSGPTGRRPGIAQGALIFGMKIFYRSSQGTNLLAGPEAWAKAIYAANQLGAGVVNMSFNVRPHTGSGWGVVKAAMESANNVTFVSGPMTSGRLPFPSQLVTDNVVLVGSRRWNMDGELKAQIEDPAVHIDAPYNPLLLAGPSFPGASNAIALVSGAIADLLGRPACDLKSPAEARNVLVKNAKTDSEEKPLLQVGFLSDPDCD